MIGVIFRAICKYSMKIVQLVMSGAVEAAVGPEHLLLPERGQPGKATLLKCLRKSP